MKLLVGILLLCVVGFANASPRIQELSPNAPADKPVSVNADKVKKFEEAIAPYVQKARATLSQAKKKYQKGLAKGEVFFVTIKIFDPDRRYETVFVRVTSWEGQNIRGILSSDLSLVHTHKKGEVVDCKEGDVLDWTISKPDGSEEGNFVGKFLDTYKP